MIEIVKNGPVTLRDVAERVGVAQATASAVLNGTRSGTRVSDKTRKELLAVAEQMGYRPNELARSLAKRPIGGWMALSAWRHPIPGYSAAWLGNTCRSFRWLTEVKQRRA